MDIGSATSSLASSASASISTAQQTPKQAPPPTETTETQAAPSEGSAPTGPGTGNKLDISV
ncbi:hypothetical protein [Breoghania sp. L-A4]|uniref:hypothetical protein n=1 Tax=Breoghania sp. L-A4 TaxID=2304600 RepID=UPI0013C36D58|nr:hypothetical protein [Breoghania sp. L-A4]